MAPRNAKIAKLKTGTHRGRPTRTGGNGYSATAGLGMSATGLRADPRLTSAAMTRITPCPTGPEPGKGGRWY